MNVLIIKATVAIDAVKPDGMNEPDLYQRNDMNPAKINSTPGTYQIDSINFIIST